MAASHFGNQWFTIDDYIKPTDTTCPAPGAFAPNGVLNGTGLPGGCTRDIVHRFYQEQYQIDGGKQDRYVTGSDAVGLTMGRYDTKALPIYQYLHSKSAPNYVVADNFFQARVRRLVPQPPVPHRRAGAAGHRRRRRRRRPTRCSTPTGSPTRRTRSTPPRRRTSWTRS